MGSGVFLSLVLGFEAVDLSLVEDGEDDGAHGDHEEAHGDGVGEYGPEVSVVEVHKAHEVLFAHGPENQRQKNGREWELVFVHQPSDDTEEDT